MRKRKFTVQILFVLVLSLICGCSSTKQVNSEKETKLPVITIGCDNYSPYSYTDVDGNMTGIDVELAKEAFSRMGYTPKFEFINWEKKKELLRKGTVDCIWSSFTMNGRENDYNWAGPYMQSHQVVAVDEKSDIKELKDLKNQVIAVQSTTKPEDIIRNHDGVLPKLRKVISVPKRDLIFLLLSKGYVDALAAHDVSIYQFMKESGLKYRILEKPLQTVNLGVAFDKNDSGKIHSKLNEVLADMRKDGSMEKIIGKYLSNPKKYLEVNYEEN